MIDFFFSRSFRFGLGLIMIDPGFGVSRFRGSLIITVVISYSRLRLVTASVTAGCRRRSAV